MLAFEATLSPESEPMKQRGWHGAPVSGRLGGRVWPKGRVWHEIEDPILGPKGALLVVTVWIERAKDNIIQFVTLKPKR